MHLKTAALQANSASSIDINWFITRWAVIGRPMFNRQIQVDIGSHFSSITNKRAARWSQLPETAAQYYQTRPFDLTESSAI
jgi:hypothetical protein